jgi:hypothetical protein
VADGNYPIRIRPPRPLGINNIIGAVIIAASGGVGVWGGFAVGFIVHQGWIITLIGAPFAVYGVVFLVAGLRLELVLTEDTAVVHGYFGTVRIPRASVQGVTQWPAIEWIDARGRTRLTPVNALNLYRSGRAAPNPTIVARVQHQIDVIHEWAGV